MYIPSTVTGCFGSQPPISGEGTAWQQYEYCGDIREVENERWCFSFWLKVIIYLDCLALLYSGSSHYYCYIAHLKEVSGVLFFNDALLIFLRNKHQYFVAHLRGQKLYGSQIWSLD